MCIPLQMASPRVAGVIPQGLPESRIKRTVEGDLGMRHNAATIVESIGLESIAANARLAPTRVSKLLDEITRDAERLPQSADEIRARSGAGMRRGAAGCGASLRHDRDGLYRHGSATVQYGRTCRASPPVGRHWRRAGQQPQSLRRAEDGRSLRPADPIVVAPAEPSSWLDRESLLYACGPASRRPPGCFSSSPWLISSRSIVKRIMNHPQRLIHPSHCANG